MTRPANNGCGEDSYVSHAVIKRNFGGSTPQVTGKMAPLKMVNISNLQELLQSENGLFRKKRMVPLVYLIYLLNIYVKRKTLSHAREKTKKHQSLFLYRAQNLPSLSFLSTNIMLSILLILAVCRTCVICTS